MKKVCLYVIAFVLLLSTVFVGKAFSVKAAAGAFNTNLEELKQVSGEWTEEDGGLRGVGMDGDVFAMSKTVGTDFIYETKVERNEGIAFSLVFRSDATGANAYVANIDFDRNTARIFYFGNGGGDLGQEYELPDPEETSFKLRLEVIGNEFRYFVNDILAVSTSDENDYYKSGFFGLLVFRGDGVFQDVIQKPLTEQTIPKLTGLEIKGAESALTYNDAAYEFQTTALPAETTEIKMIPQFESGEVTVSAYDYTEKILLAETAVVSGAESPAIAMTSRSITVLVKIKNGDAEITKTIQITKEDPPKTSAPAKTTSQKTATKTSTPSSNGQGGNKGPSDNDSTFIIIAIAAAAVIAVGIVIFVIIKKKKK